MFFFRGLPFCRLMHCHLQPSNIPPISLVVCLLALTRCFTRQESEFYQMLRKRAVILLSYCPIPLGYFLLFI